MRHFPLMWVFRRKVHYHDKKVVLSELLLSGLLLVALVITFDVLLIIDKNYIFNYTSPTQRHLSLVGLVLAILIISVEAWDILIALAWLIKLRTTLYSRVVLIILILATSLSMVFWSLVIVTGQYERFILFKNLSLLMLGASVALTSYMLWRILHDVYV
ncbi:MULTISPECIES: hypothetical protein [unclassified Mycoplasma]|uniref:hypothetical protein n=1 Tax=unclassified Mycoplasma TaxID=2683645 RepID=UPI000FDF27E3